VDCGLRHTSLLLALADHEAGDPVCRRSNLALEIIVRELFGSFWRRTSVKFGTPWVEVMPRNAAPASMTCSCSAAGGVQVRIGGVWGERQAGALGGLQQQ
jgi:hypothetical protein